MICHEKWEQHFKQEEDGGITGDGSAGCEKEADAFWG